MRKLSITALLCVCWLSLSAWAENSAVGAISLVEPSTSAAASAIADCAVIGPGFQSTELFAALEVAEDRSASWSLRAAGQQPFKHLSDRKVGYRTGAVWARFCVKNNDVVDRAMVLDAGDKHFTRVGLSVLTHGAAQPMLSAEYGTTIPYSRRAIRARNIVFPLTLRAGETVDIYLRYQGEVDLRVAPSLSDSTAFLRAQHADDVMVYAFYGALAALFIYNLLLALSSRESAAVTCIALTGAWAALGASWDGVLYQWWPESLGFYHLSYLYISVSAVIVSLAVFTIEFLQLKQQPRRFLIPQYALIVLALIFIPLTWLLSKQMLRDCVLVLFTLSLSAAIITGSLLYRRGQGYAGVYLAGYLVMFFSLIVAARQIYLPNRGANEVELWVRLAILAPIAIFCVGVGYRINKLKVTATENQQRALLARAEAEFKSRFLVTMSHEIRTPLNGVVGMIELLQGTPLSEIQRRYVDVIHSSGRALMDVINDVLDFSKLEHGKVKLEIIGFNLERLVDECIDVFAITKKSGAVVFNACIEPGTPLLIMGDPTRTKQVLINLVGNAFKFTQAGEVNLNISLVSLPGSIDNLPSLKFAVTDTGIGMDGEARQQLFTAFTQADGSITRKYGGTGLGLAICKQLVELMGGIIGVDSQTGVGSTFWFTLPLLLPSANDAIEPLARAPVLAGKRILVVDDHDAFCHTMRVALESFGMLVTVAQTAQAARDCLREAVAAPTVYDVLMIDRCLPDQDGLELAQDLYRASRQRTPPILLVSVAVDILEDDTLQQAGVVAHMIKPISLNNLQKRLARLFDSDYQQAIVPPPALLNAQGTPLRALVAEDNQINQIVLGGLLNKLGVEAVFVGDGKQAVDLYIASLDTKERAFDVIIMDCEMPNLDGYSATRHIRQHETKYMPARSIRIIGLTAHAIDEYRERAFAAGMHDFLTKPVHFETLKRALALVK
jgi:two-component system, sensor histidine kinase RetS